MYEAGVNRILFHPVVEHVVIDKPGSLVAIHVTCVVLTKTFVSFEVLVPVPRAQPAVCRQQFRRHPCRPTSSVQAMAKRFPGRTLIAERSAQQGWGVAESAVAFPPSQRKIVNFAHACLYNFHDD